MNETKKWYESTGIVGPIVAVIAFIMDSTGVNVISAAELNKLLLSIMEGAGMIIGIVGRWKATKQIG